MPYEQPFLDIALNALTQEQLIQHLRERLLEKDKLTQEIEELKKQNEKLKMVAKANQSLAERVRQLEQEKVLKGEQ